MGTNSFTSNQKICPTCEYWTGTREPEVMNSKVRVEFSAKGKCLGLFKNATKNINNSCGDWAKWSILK